jgi:hypothetical protein
MIKYYDNDTVTNTHTNYDMDYEYEYKFDMNYDIQSNSSIMISYYDTISIQSNSSIKISYYDNNTISNLLRYGLRYIIQLNCIITIQIRYDNYIITVMNTITNPLWYVLL